MGKKNDKDSRDRANIKWVILISFWTFIMAVIFNIITESLVKHLDIFLAFIILILVILVGIFFDIVGIAVASAQEMPFHAMAANKVEEARYAIRLIKNASQVSNFCNDVIGDIAGIISGSLGATIIFKLINIYDIKNASILSILITSLIAAFTVGGKALGKTYAMVKSEKIIFQIAKILNFLEGKLNLKLMSNKKKKNNRK